jgi:hypothetical protein
MENETWFEKTVREGFSTHWFQDPGLLRTDIHMVLMGIKEYVDWKFDEQANGKA